MIRIFVITFTLLHFTAIGAFSGTVDDAQRMLNQLGYNAGAVDGAYGGKTKRALEAFYSDNGGAFDGKLDANELADLTKILARSNNVEQTTDINISDKYRFENFAGIVNLSYAHSLRKSWYGYPEIPLIDVTDDGHGDLVFNSDGPDFWRQQNVGKNDANVVVAPYVPKWKEWDVFETITSPNSTHGSPFMKYADMNGDGRIDIVAATSVPGGSFNNGGAVIYYNQGDGTFKTKTISRKKFTHAIGVGDLDGDGDQDLIYHQLGAKYIKCEINDGRGNFKRKDCMLAPKVLNHGWIENVWGFRVADFDNDGAQDVAVFATVGSEKVDNSWGATRKNQLQHPTIFWGNNSVKFSYNNSTAIDVSAWTDGAMISGKPYFLTSYAGSTVDISNDGDVDLVTTLIGKHSIGGAVVILENLGNRKFRAKEIYRSTFLKNDPKRFRSMQDKTDSINTHDDYTWLTEGIVWNDSCGNVMFVDINRDGIDDFVCGGSGFEDSNAVIVDRWTNHQKEHQRVMPWMNTTDWDPKWSVNNVYVILDKNGNAKDTGKIFNTEQTGYSEEFKSGDYQVRTIGFFK